MNYIKTKIDGVFIIEPIVHKDARGYFCETFKETEFFENIGKVNFVQENENKSSYGVLRGLHFQKPPYAQSKLARVVDGAVLDVAVDIRKGSPTFGEWVAVELSSENHRQLFLPHGMAHAMLCLSPTCIFYYKVDNYYNQQSEGFIAWDDPDLAIDWQIPSKDIILSEKDKHHPCLKDIELVFDYNK
jgi:dTDP-4-dehydrorhamnose 3,5-epimerase